MVPEVMSALSTGPADTTLAPAAWMLGMQDYQYAGYYITPPLLYSPPGTRYFSLQQGIENQFYAGLPGQVG